MRTLLGETESVKRMRQGEAARATLVLFPDGVYLRDLLKEAAKAFFGAQAGSRTARLIDGESFLDCAILPPAGGKLTAELSARIVDESLLRPAEGNKKLFVLDAFGTAAPLVQNKLLKILEEPPEGVFFLLGATAEHGVLPTVRSRVNVISEPPFREEAIVRALERNYAGAEGIREAAASCGGIYSAAEKTLKSGEEFALAEEFLAGGDISRICREIEKHKQEDGFFSAVRLLLRDMLFIKTGQAEYVSRAGERAASLAADYSAGALVASLGAVAAAEREIQFHANVSQAAYTLALRVREEKEKWQRLS